MMPRVPSKALEGLLYALVAFAPLAFGCVEPWSRATLEVLAFLLAFGCFLRGRPSVPPAADSFWLFPAAMAAYGLVQLLAPAPADGPLPLEPFTVSPRATQASALLWAAYAALVWSVPRIIASHEAARRLSRFLFGLGVAIAAQGLLQRATGGKLYWLRSAGEAHFFGPYYNCDHAANFLMMALGAGAGIFFSKTRRWPAVDGPPADYVRSQGTIAAAALILLAGILVCGARGALLAMPLAGAALACFAAGFARRRRDRRLRAAAALAGAGVIVFLVYRYVAANADAGALVDSAVSTRFMLYVDSLRMWRDAPLFGTGLGSFSAAYPAYQDFDLRAIVSEAHSDWVQLGVEAGLLGVAAALAAALYAAFHSLRTWRDAGSAEMRALIAGALASAAAFAIHSLFEFNFQIPANAAVFFVLVGFLLSAPSWADKGAAKARPEAPAFWAAALAAGCFVLAATAAVRPAAAAWLADRQADSAEHADALWRGFALDPDPRFLKSLSTRALRSAGYGENMDYRALRVGLGLSLKAAELRPFDSEARFLSGVSLSRLGRRQDAAVLLEEARLIRFSPLFVRGPADPGMERTIEILRSKGLMPARGARR